MNKIAILIDGAFFLKRHNFLYPPISHFDAVKTADNMMDMTKMHLDDSNSQLYRILYYDCLPLDKKAQHPITKKQIDFSKSKTAKFRHEFYEILKKRRKVALRLGFLSDSGGWILNAKCVKELIKNKKKAADITEKDIKYNTTQKGVDMKIAVDIASLSYKRHVNQIILVAGDSDFVPAAKLARREGIDFILDPMYNNVNPELFEHIDGLTSKCPKPDKIRRPQEKT